MDKFRLVLVFWFILISAETYSDEGYLLKIYYKEQPSEEVVKINPEYFPASEDQDIDIVHRRIKSFSADNAPLKSILYGILSDTNISVVFDPDVDTKMPLTVKFENVELLSALNSIMQMANLSFILEGKILKIKTTLKRIYKIPYVKISSTYTSSVGGSLTGGGGGGGIGGGVAGGTVAAGGGGAGGITGDYSVGFEGGKDIYDLYSQIEQNIRAILSDKGNFTLNKLTGTVVVEDRPDRVKLVENFILNLKKELDKQVLIEAKIVEVILSDSYQYGIDWTAVARNFLNTGMTVSQNLSLGSSVVSLSVAKSDLNALVNAVATFGKVNTLSNPRILVVNNQTAVLTAGSIYPFWDKQVATAGGGLTGQPLTAVTYQRRNILSGILLGVVPHIEDDGDIIVNIVPISTSIQGIRQYKEGTNIVAEAPILNIKESGTIVRVKDGDTIIIGGLIDKEEKNEEIKVPFFGDIPLFGHLFKQKTKSIQNKELILFLKITKVDFKSPY